MYSRTETLSSFYQKCLLGINKKQVAKQTQMQCLYTDSLMCVYREIGNVFMFSTVLNNFQRGISLVLDSAFYFGLALL